VNAVDRLAVAALTDVDNTEGALAWLLEQWLSDVDREHADWCLAGLRHEDPELFDVLDAIHFDDTGEPLLADELAGGDLRPPAERETSAGATHANRNAPAAAGTGSGA
jgi:hypothetical protein